MASQVNGIPVSTANSNGETYTLIGSYDIYDRDYAKRLLRKVPKAGALQWMKALAGQGYMQKRQCIRDQYYYHEEGQWFATVATIANAVDNTTYATITLSAADHDNSGANSYPVVNQLVLFENEVVGFVRSINRSVAGAHTIDVYPTDTTNSNIFASAQVGSVMSFYSNAQQEASTQTEVRVPKTSKVTNYVQTFRDSYRVTDQAARNQVEWEWEGQKFLYIKGLDEMFDRFKMAEDFGLLVTTASNNLTNAGGNSIQLAKGLIPQITDSGNTMEYYGTPDKTTFDDAVLILNRNYGNNEYVVGMGLNLYQGLENWLVEFSKGGDNNISFSLFDGGKKQALALDFQSVTTAGYTFHFQRWDAFSHSDSLGAGNMPYRDMGVFIPTGKVPNGIGEDEPYLTLVYADTNHAPHEDKGDHAVWETGGQARRGGTNDTNERRVHIISHKSLEVRNRNKFMVLRKAV